MLRHDIVFPPGASYPSGTMKPPDSTTMPKDGQQYESDPALVAMTLSSHSGFDAVVDTSMRVMTPPPQYSRVEPSRFERSRQLTLRIPDTTQGEALPSACPRSPNIRFSPDIAVVQDTETSPVENSPSREKEGRFLESIIAWKRKHCVVFGRSIRRPGSGSRSSSRTTSPQDGSSTPPWSPNGLANEIQELDSHEINMAVPQVPQSQETSPQQFGPPDLDWHHEIVQQRPQRQSSFSSIIPTPRRFRSVAGPAPRHRSDINFDANLLANQLESLAEGDARTVHESMVSPCSTTSPGGVWQDQSLMRSGAITDRPTSSLHHLISALGPHPRSPSPPPVTPTFDGRLDKLPRIETPAFQNANQSIYRLNATRQVEPSLQALQILSEEDSGKELVVQSNVSRTSRERRLHQPFSAPHWEGNQGQSPSSVPKIVVDHAAHAPEVAASSLGSPVMTEPMIHIVRKSPPWVYTERPLKQPSPLATMTGMVLEAALSGILKTTELLRYHYGPEPPVPERHVRVRWKCVSNSWQKQKISADTRN